MPKEEIQEQEEKEAPLKKSKKIEKLQEELAKAKEEAEKWKNEYYRAYADTQNLRRGLEKEHLEAMKYRSEGFLSNLLPVLDSFHIVLQNEPSDPALKNYLVGFQYIYRNLVASLENEGVKEIAPNIGDMFDASTMNALDTTVVEGEEENKIIKIYAKGYKLHDRLIRPANVCVSKKKEEEKPENKETDA